jgi:hypothetical protein
VRGNRRNSAVAFGFAVKKGAFAAKERNWCCGKNPQQQKLLQNKKSIPAFEKKMLFNRHERRNGMVATTNLTQEKIARRAYEIFLARGKRPGKELDDWLQAEREVTKYESGSASDTSQSKKARPMSTQSK